MKKLLLLFIFQFTNSSLFAQWTPVNNGLGNTSVSSMFAFVDTILVGTANGIFKTLDNGDNWIDISGNIGNKNINDIRGGGAPRVIWAATKGGPFMTNDHVNYVNNTSTGLTNTDISYYWFGGENETNAEWAIGTNGGGLFTSQELNGPWTAASTGLTGNGLIVNDLSGYSDNSTDYAVLATNNGIYYSSDNLSSWTAKNSGLSGEALLVKRLSAIGSGALLATRGGLFLAMNIGETYYTLIPNEKFNTAAILQAGTGLEVYAFGEKGFHSTNFMSYDPIDLSGVTGGEVTSFAKNSAYIFVGTASGGVFRKSLTGPTNPVSAAFTATPTSGLVPLTVQFTDNSTVPNSQLNLLVKKLLQDNTTAATSVTTWAWDFDNDGTVDATMQNPSHTFLTPGNFTVSLTVSDGTNSDTETKVNFISAIQLIADFTATPVSGTAPLTVQFTDNSTASNATITSWSWDFDNDGTADATTQNPSFIYQNAGSYSVSLTISNSLYAKTQTKTNYISVGLVAPQVTAAFSATPTSGLTPLSVQFANNSTASNTTITALAWDFDNNGTVDATVPNPSHSYLTPGNYSVSLTVTDSTISDTETKVNFISALQLNADFTATPVSGAPPLTVQFTDNSTASNTIIASWAWDFDNNGTVEATTKNPAFTYQNAGSYSVSLTISNSLYSKTVTKTNYISVGQVAPQITSAFSATPTSGLVPLSVLFTDNSTVSNTTITSWAWDFDNNGTVDATVPNPSHIYQAPGNYAVSLTVGDGTITDAEIKTNYISARQLTAVFMATPTSGFAPLTVQFNDHSYASNTTITTWQWDFTNDGTVDATTQNPSHTYQSPGKYTVSLKASDSVFFDSYTANEIITVAQLNYPTETTVTTTYNFPTHSNIADFHTTDYIIFGAPGNSGVDLQEFLNTPYKEKWQAYYDNGAAQNYLVEYSQSANFQLTTGKAFWLLHNGPINLNSTVVTAPLDAQHNAIVPLHAGWNMITNPFAASIKWDDIKIANALSDPLFSYNTGFSTSNTMAPYTGYYLFNTNNLPSLKIPFYATLTSPLEKITESENDFSLNIFLCEKNKKLSEIILGLNKKTQRDFDVLDYRKPRFFSDHPDILFLRPEWNEKYSSFYSDIRPEIVEFEEWKFQVVQAMFKQVQLKFDKTASVNFPDSTVISLVDWANSKWINLAEQNHYDFIGNAEPMNFSLFIGLSSPIDDILSSIVPEAFVLSQNFPNPFNNETLITFTCPEPTELDVFLFNAVGQRVRSLYSGLVSPGRTTFKWDGRDENGRSLSSGVYIFSLRTQANKQFSKKIIFMK